MGSCVVGPLASCSLGTGSRGSVLTLMQKPSEPLGLPRPAVREPGFDSDNTCGLAQISVQGHAAGGHVADGRGVRAVCWGVTSVSRVSAGHMFAWWF